MEKTVRNSENSENNRKKIILFDTTLRDGHQCPGAAIENDKDYFDVVRGLDLVGFDICEVGFPASSVSEAHRVHRVAQMCKEGEISTIVAGLTQMVDFQVEAALKALEPAADKNKGLFHIYFPVDPNLRAASIGNKISNTQAIEDVAKFSKTAKDLGLLVQFSPEGYSNIGDNFDFCSDLLIAAAENGATYFNLPDTKGSEDPDNPDKEYYVDTIKRHKAILDRLFPDNTFVWSVHNHNDLGLAAQNSINGVKPGTGINKIEGTINGIGERAGNADLNQIIVRMKTTLQSTFDIEHIRSEHITHVSQLVSRLMLPVQPNSPITGSNSMRHTSGGHANAMLKNPTVYQPFAPEIVGGSISLVYGPNSGGNLAINIIEKNGYICPKSDKRLLDTFLKERMQESGRYKGITDKELIELYKEFRSPIKITDYTKSKVENSNRVSVYFSGVIFGNQNLTLEGETVFTALKDFISENMPGYHVDDYNSRSESKGSRSVAISEVIIICEETQEKIIGKGKDSDIETSSLKALANAFNQIFVENEYKRIDS